MKVHEVRATPTLTAGPNNNIHRSMRVAAATSKGIPQVIIWLDTETAHNSEEGGVKGRGAVRAPIITPLDQILLTNMKKVMRKAKRGINSKRLLRFRILTLWISSLIIY